MTPPEDAPRRLAAERIAAVRARFAASLPERLAALAALAEQAAGADAAAASSADDSLRLGLHNLSGAAPTLGLHELGRRAAAIEARFIASRRPGGGLDAETASVLAGDIIRLVETRE